ncbi:hypothetical protein B0H11DRAFT_1922639 [Mycena galericulata]|nr:hypothetical protein B0H11DRAFT_1922639 [Mycena galericulata]
MKSSVTPTLMHRPGVEPSSPPIVKQNLKPDTTGAVIALLASRFSGLECHATRRMKCKHNYKNKNHPSYNERLHRWESNPLSANITLEEVDDRMAVCPGDMAHSGVAVK